MQRGVYRNAFAAFLGGPSMSVRLVGLLGVSIWIGSVMSSGPHAAGAQTASRAAAPSTQPTSTTAAVVTRYCAGCHNERARTGGLTLTTLDFANVPADAEVWEKVIRKVRTGMMPPVGVPHPDAATRAAFVTSLSTALDRAAAAKPNPGRPALYRMNRSEYANAIRDLLDLEVDAPTLLPPDDAAYGFDNIADVLSVSSTLMEQYVSAAGRVSALAVGSTDVAPGSEVFRIRQDASQDRHIEGLPFGTVGGLLARPVIQVEGDYTLSSKFFRTNLGVMRGLEYEHWLEYAVDGQRVHLFRVGGTEDWAANLENNTLIGDQIEERSRVNVRLTPGPHDITVAWIDRGAAADPYRVRPPIRSSHDTRDPLGIPHLLTFTVAGPYPVSGNASTASLEGSASGDTPSRRRIFVCRPEPRATREAEEACAARIVSALVRRAYRGQATDADTQRLLTFYREARQEGTFDTGIEAALQRMLASPKFIFRVERDPQQTSVGDTFAISDLELASRLAFFLWSSIPDDLLLQAATQGRLRVPAELERQVRRMLADPKAERLTTNFAGQWLHLRNLRTQQPNSMEFPDFDDNLRDALEREAWLFFDSIRREDRNVLDLMTADYTFVNERLARHYGIPDVYGSRWRRVTLADEARRGLLGKAAILTVTSNADRTSPVKRGKWVLDNILNAPPPPPPPDVPPFNEDATRGGKVLSVRERLEEHRTNPVCANCHRMFDPIGLALENFDATGAWRSREGGTRGNPIDATGELSDGTKVDGVVSLRRALVREPDMFVGTVVEKLMTYALGRGLTAHDMPTVRGIVRQAASREYRFSAVVLGIVKSAPFTMRLKAGSESRELVATR
jgi:mono/diheme cytochrome c family protein